MFWNKVYDVIVLYDIINKILLHDWNFTVDVAIWPKVGNSRISIKAVSWLQSYKDLTRKNTFFKGGQGSSSIICDWH